MRGWDSVIVPTNQIENFGFGKYATHTLTGKSENISDLPEDSSHWNIAPIEKETKEQLLKEIYGISRFTQSVLSKIKN